MTIIEPISKRIMYAVPLYVYKDSVCGLCENYIIHLAQWWSFFVILVVSLDIFFMDTFSLMFPVKRQIKA